jgi:hypothetical protein
MEVEAGGDIERRVGFKRLSRNATDATAGRIA